MPSVRILFSDEIEDLMDLLQDMGLRWWIRGNCYPEEEVEEEELEEYEKTEDLVQAYFHSMVIFPSLRRTKKPNWPSA